MSWPSASDLQTRLAAAQVTMPDGSAVPASIASAALMAAAISKFEELTGWVPFEGATETRPFDPPGRAPMGVTHGGGNFILPLNNGLISVTTLTVQSVAKTANSDFWLMRSRPDMPAWGIRFAVPVWGPPQCISIAGSWGRMATADELAMEAVLNIALQMVCQMIRDGFATSPAEWKEADVSERMSIENIAKLGDGFGALAEPVINLYKRVTVGF